MSTLLLSGMSVPIASAHNSQTTTFTFPSAAATFAGSASAFLSGPTLVGPGSSASSGGPTTENGQIPNIRDLNPKPTNAIDPPSSPAVPPNVNCDRSGGPSCASISLNHDGAKTNPNAINAYENRLNQKSQGAKFTTVEPPDQGLCAGNGFVLEPLNIGNLQVFTSDLKPVSGIIPLDGVIGLSALGWSSGGDIMCQYDSANGGHWFITEFVSATKESDGGPFVGCFVGTPDTCYEGIAVSETNNPMGAYNVYFINAAKVNNDPGSDSNPFPSASFCTSQTLPSNCGKGVLLNDYAKTALTRDAFLVFYNEYNLFTGAFIGAQEFAFSKIALENGLSTVNVAYENMGNAPNLYPIPANGNFQPIPLTGNAWYQAIPTQTTDPSEYNNENGGMGFMLSSLDFFGTGDNRVAAFDWTHLSALNSFNCGSCGSITFGGQLITSGVTYQDEGASCFASQYNTPGLTPSGVPYSFCGLAPQKIGTIPQGFNCGLLGLATGVTSCPVGGIATNGDGAEQAFMAQDTLWTAVSTLVVQHFEHGSPEIHVGATFWAVGVQTSGGEGDDSPSGVTFQIEQQGYVSASHEDIAFPAVAASEDTTLLSFTLSGNGGPTGADHGGFFPSSAYLLLSNGDRGSAIHIADLGKSPTDGFSEYQGYDATTTTFFTRPRWGDYGQAVFDPTTGKFFFASEFIQHPNCGSAAWLLDLTCGGTRAPAANWGSSVNSFSP
jgi:hypothetical protein